MFSGGTGEQWHKMASKRDEILKILSQKSHKFSFKDVFLKRTRRRNKKTRLSFCQYILIYPAAIHFFNAINENTTERCVKSV